MSDALLARLQAHANTRGVVIVSEETLVQELGGAPGALRRALDGLVGQDAVEVLSPLPFLVLKLKKWSGMSGNASNSSPRAYSYSKLFQSQQLNNSYRQGGQAAAPTDGNLLQEVLDTLGETDQASFVKAIELYSPHVIRTALDRVRRARDIRKSRTALFRHLLPRLARDAGRSN